MDTGHGLMVLLLETHVGTGQRLASQILENTVEP